MKNLILFGACLMTFILGGLNVVLHYGGDGTKAKAVVHTMTQCIEQEKVRGKGQDHLDTVHRICWMRAQRT